MKRKFLTENTASTAILDRGFYSRDVLEVAPDLIGKILIVSNPGFPERRAIITEVEAYRGTEDKACHASKGRTRRTEIMFQEGGRVYVYFVYGMYWMLNVVTAGPDIPQAVLIRGIEGFSGPGKLTRELGIDGSFYGEDLVNSSRIWIEDDGIRHKYITTKRIGIDYSGEPWKSKQWRYLIQ